jgi:hypothetical protein
VGYLQPATGTFGATLDTVIETVPEMIAILPTGTIEADAAGLGGFGVDLVAPLVAAVAGPVRAVPAVATVAIPVHLLIDVHFTYVVPMRWIRRVPWRSGATMSNAWFFHLLATPEST